MGDSETQPGKSSPAPRQRPRDAATLVIVDHSTGEPRMLMGQRHPEQTFLPNKFVFPGGRVEPADRTVHRLDDLRPSQIARLMIDMKGEPSEGRARALALAAVRETFEEAGLLIGARHGLAAETCAGAWQNFMSHGFLPKIGAMTYFARAITPPGRPRRYDTRFFCIEASEIAHRIDLIDGELSHLDWFSFDEMRTLDLPGITRVVIEDLRELLQSGKHLASNAPIPFYFHRNSSFERVLLI